ncbi:hypothetical protein [Methylobacterium sp. 1030]|uniref:hypothetical protein n=1 Tax=Methylobacterium sp. 1030 TaxID=3156404 RepID=UPI003394A1F1
MTKDSWGPGSTISNEASRLILETEASVRLAFPGAFLGYEEPCGHAEKAISSEADPHVRGAAERVHDRARETSSCMHNL